MGGSVVLERKTRHLRAVSVETEKFVLVGEYGAVAFVRA